jgi:methanogenic corrinoid protein MtbC1
MKPFAHIAEQFEHALVTVDRVGAQQILQDAFQQSGYTDTIDQVLTPALEHIGQQWELGQIALSQVYMSGVICEELMTERFPQQTPHQTDLPPMAIVTFEDYHVLGKRLVLSILHAYGLPVKDFGVGIQTEALVGMVKKHGTEILLISTLMLPSALHVANVREQLECAKHDVKIVVGGAPFRFDDQLWEQVGADAMGRTAADAVRITKQLVKNA